MAFPSVTNNGTVKNTSGTAATSFVVDMPDSIVSGNLLLGFGWLDGITSCTWPGTWTILTDTDSPSSAHLEVYYRIAGGSEPADITITSASEQAVFYILQIQDWHGTTPPEVGTATGTSAAPNSPSLSPSWGSADTLWLTTWSLNGGSTVSTWPTSYTLTQLQGTTGGSGSAGGAVAGRQVAAASEDPGAWAIADSNGWVAATIAVRPAAGGSPYSIVAAQGSFTLTGQATGLTAGRLIGANQGSYTQTGQSTGLKAARLLTAAQGSNTLTGQNTSLIASRLIGAEQGSYSLTGQDTGLLASRLIAAAQGSYTLTGQDTSLLANRLLTAAQGSYTLTGQDVTLTYTPLGGATYTLTAAQGSYTLSGQDTGILAQRLLSAGQGSYTLTGQDASVLVNRLLAANQGSYTLSGQSATLLVSRLLTASQGSHALTGQTITLVYSGAILPVTPDTRVYVVPTEDRIYVIVDENRTFVIDSENRTLVLH